MKVRSVKCEVRKGRKKKLAILGDHFVDGNKMVEQPAKERQAQAVRSEN